MLRWTPNARRQHSRDDLRYETNLTDAEWALVKPLMPEPSERGRRAETPFTAAAHARAGTLLGAADRFLFDRGD
jgi:transposase